MCDTHHGAYLLSPFTRNTSRSRSCTNQSIQKSGTHHQSVAGTCAVNVSALCSRLTTENSNQQLLYNLRQNEQLIIYKD
jgi:hypothetical protein